MKSCRICGFITYDPEAEKCAICQSEFDPSTVKKSEKKSQKKPSMKLSTEIAIIFVITCALMLPFIFWMDSVGVAVDNPGLLIVGVFAGLFVLLFAIYIFIKEAYKKKHPAEAPEENVQNPYYTESDASAQVNAWTESETKAEKVDYSNLNFNEQIVAISKENPYPTLTFNAQMTVPEATDQMAQSSKLPASQLRTTLAAMASRRLIVICGESEDHTASALQSVSALTGTEAINITLGEDCVDSKALLVTEDPQKGPLPSQFLNALCVGAEDEALYNVDLKAEATNKLAPAFSDLTLYLEHAFSEREVKAKDVNRKYANLSGDETVMLPANRRIFLRISSDRQIPLDAELLRSAAWVEAKAISSREVIEDTSDESEIETINALSFNRLLQLTEESEKVCYLAEETWKRIDELSDYLAQFVDFRMDNKLAVAMERFVGVYMASGSSETEATDAVIASLILPQTLALLSRKQDRDHAPLLQFIDGHFGMENLPMCADFLKKYGTI